MLDPAEFSTDPQHTPALGTPAPSPTLEEADPRPHPRITRPDPLGREFFGKLALIRWWT